MYAENMGYKCTLKEAILSKASWWLPKIKIPSQSKVESSIDINVTGWSVMIIIIEESSRTFGERFREHLKAPSPIYDHFNITGCGTPIDNFSIVGKEDLNLIRVIKEAIYIRVNNPYLNGNIGK